VFRAKFIDCAGKHRVTPSNKTLTPLATEVSFRTKQWNKCTITQSDAVESISKIILQ